MKTVILTGASRGIGATIADLLLKDENVNIVVIARSSEPLRNLRIKYGEERVATLVGDVSQSENIDRLIELAISKYGQIDSIIANAGVLEPVDAVGNASVDAWKQLFSVNFFSVVELVSKALPYLKKSAGNVVLVSSGASTKSYYGWGAYGASKAAINQFAVQLAGEEPAVSVVAVAPGVVDTQMQQDIRDKFGANMTSEALKRFIDLKVNHELLDPVVPATIYANLAVRGFKQLSGKYLRYSDEPLAAYAA